MTLSDGSSIKKSFLKCVFFFLALGQLKWLILSTCCFQMKQKKKKEKVQKYWAKK